MSEQQTPVHISVVLDRSGSMASISDDVVGGFNTFLSEQRRHPAGGRITLVQFDSQDPFEVLIDGEDLSDVADLDPARYLPRGTTPLFDAVGRMIATVDTAILARADDGLPIEDQVVLIVTDGFENASREFDGPTIAALIEERKGRGWAFAFLGSDQATFDQATAMKIADKSTLAWDKSAQGTAEMFSRASQATLSYRTMSPEKKRESAERYFDQDDDPK